MRYPILPLISIGNRPMRLELCQPAPWLCGKNGYVSDQTNRTLFENYFDKIGFCHLKISLKIPFSWVGINEKNCKLVENVLKKFNPTD